MDVISSPSGNGSNGVVGIPLQLLLNFNERSVAVFCRIARFHQKVSRALYPDALTELPIRVYNLSRG